MSYIKELAGIPESDVAEFIADLESAGATKVEKIKQPDGNWTVRATFPD